MNLVVEESIAGGGNVVGLKIGKPRGYPSTSWRRSGAYQSLTDQASFAVSLKSMVSIKLSSARHPPIGLWTWATLMEVFPLEGKLDDGVVESLSSLSLLDIFRWIMNISFFFPLPLPCRRVYLFSDPTFISK